MVTIWRMCHQQHIKHWALAVLSKRVELQLRPLQRISHGNCFTVVKEQLWSAWNVHLQHEHCEPLSHIWQLWLDLKWVWGRFWKVILCRQPGRYDEQACENCPAYLPRCTTASCLCCAFSLYVFLPLSSALCILLSLITAFQWHLTSFANVTCEGRALFCVYTVATHSLLWLVALAP